MTKQKIIFTVGYTPNLLHFKELYGSELALLNLAHELSKKYDIHIFGDSQQEGQIKKVKIQNSNKLNEFIKKNEIDILIVHRYINQFLNYELTKIKKIYFWIHDNTVHDAFNGTWLPNAAKALLKNIDKKITKYITLTPWHKKYFQETYQIKKEKITVIGNAHNHKPTKTKKDQNLFVWHQSPERNLIETILNFSEITKIIPNAKLEIYGNKDYLTQKGIKLEYLPKNITHKGYKENKEIQKKLNKAKYWLYTTKSHETYCIGALEAQLAKCICISTNHTGIKDTLGNSKRGILLKQKPFSKEYYQELQTQLTKNKENEQKIKEAFQYAKKQTWPNKAKEWTQLFNLQ